MGLFTVGDVVIVAFPYADFSRLKKRPAIIVAEAEFNNFILCQVTSKAKTSSNVVPLTSADFSQGGLPIDSYARPDKLFTVEQSVLMGKMGTLHSTTTNSIKSHVRQLFV